MPKQRKSIFSSKTIAEDDDESSEETLDSLSSLSIDELTAKTALLHSSLTSTKISRAKIAALRPHTVTTRITTLRDKWSLSLLAAQSRRTVSLERLRSTTYRLLQTTNLHNNLMQMHSLNDVFFIWHAGKFATINGFRLGKLTTVAVDWNEINAALGHAALLLATVAANPRNDLVFSQYRIVPMCSFTKIIKLDNEKYEYPLYNDASFKLMGNRGFNVALKGLLYCLSDAAQYVAEQDRTMQLPHPLTVDKHGSMTVGGLVTGFHSNDEEWTRAMKYFLTDLKWVVAWVAKHLA